MDATGARRSRIAIVLYLILVCCTASSALATTFIVPDDKELVQKSDAIVTGVVLSARPFESEHFYIETAYEIAVDRVLKGPIPARERMVINTPGGVVENRMMHVASSAHFQVGDEVLLFLTRDRGGWTTTDMTLGRFLSKLTNRGHRVAVRDADEIVGWNRAGKVHREKIRLEAEFLHFIEEAVAGREVERESYETEPGEIIDPEPQKGLPEVTPHLYPAPATSYSTSLYSVSGTSGNCTVTRFAGRWTTATMNAGIVFNKNSAQDASTLGDGGISIIQNATAAWTNDCESAINMTYGTEVANLHNNLDGVNTVIFNDPNGSIAGSWTGSGTIAVCFSRATSTHTHDGSTFASYSDSDVVFQNGFPGNHASIEEAMTHEIGHGIGFRHSDKDFLSTCTGSDSADPDAVCDTVTCNPETSCDGTDEECSSGAAIMTASVSGGINYTLQTWDQHAADALYPGTCVVVLPPTAVVATATSETTVNVSWVEAADADSYNVYRSTDGTNYTLAGNTGTAVTFFNDTGRSANTAYLYKVRSVDGVTQSTDSGVDLATTTIFTDASLAGATVKAAHFNELVTAINAVRTLADIGAGTYTGGTLSTGASVLAVHITDRRTAIDAARSDLGLPAMSYSRAITGGVTTIEAVDVIELREAIQ